MLTPRIKMKNDAFPYLCQEARTKTCLVQPKHRRRIDRTEPIVDDPAHRKAVRQWPRQGDQSSGEKCILRKLTEGKQLSCPQKIPTSLRPFMYDPMSSSL